MDAELKKIRANKKVSINNMRDVYGPLFLLGRSSASLLCGRYSFTPYEFTLLSSLFLLHSKDSTKYYSLADIGSLVSAYSKNKIGQSVYKLVNLGYIDRKQNAGFNKKATYSINNMTLTIMKEYTRELNKLASEYNLY